MLSHNSRRYDTQFLRREFMEIRWTPQLIMDGTKILSMVVENLYLLDSLHFLPMSLKSMPNLFDIACKKGYYTHFFNRQRIWIMWVLILNTSCMGQTTWQVMSEPSFWNGTRSKRTNFFPITKNSWPIAWKISMY